MRISHRLVAVPFVVVSCCGSGAETPAEEERPAAPSTPVVTGERTDLVLSWFADGGSATAASVAEVPQSARTEVRVQDPTIPPEERDPGWIFLADLTKKEAGGRYAVRAVPRAEYEAGRREARAPAAAASSGVVGSPSGSGAAAATGGGAPVVMYSTRHCPVCMKARKWLLDIEIPYVERDIERDQGAAAELAEKGRRQGVPTSGVPVFDVRGKLVAGFDPAVILKLLSGASAPQQTI
jgi:glutaredoxin